MEPSGSSPLNATEVGLLFIADHAMCVALDEDPTQGSWWFRLHASRLSGPDRDCLRVRYIVILHRGGS